jgi:replicative DNA helicase
MRKDKPYHKYNTRQSEEPDFSKLPPQAIEIEQSVLGALMTLPQTLDKALLSLRPEVFYKEANKLIYQAIIELHRDSKGVDMLTVAEKLKQAGQLDAVGGVYYISTMTNNNIGPFDEWCAILKQKFSRRECIRIGAELVNVGYDDSIDELESYNALDMNHKTLSDLLFGVTDLVSFQDVARESLRELKARMENEVTGITTGIRDLDATLGGWSNGDLVIIAGRPGMGKTAIALHHAKVAARLHKHVYMFSLEMANVRIADRVIVGETGINNYQYKLGNVNSYEFEQIREWVESNSNLPIHLDEKSFVGIDYIISNCRMRKRKNELDMVIIDYLQLVDMAQEKNGTRDQAIGLVTRKLKSLAKELNVPILVLSQLNRKVEERTNKRPSLQDLRESGNIEQDADIVIFCYRPAYYKIEQYESQSTAGLMVLEVSKNRNGMSNVDIRCEHNESLTVISDPEQMDEPVDPNY